uniref:AB hydrolase-1 domain-containing protein n=1 Tax=Globodera rostochiensis TaxID=31243 RepID=A0A914HCA9_GLORO
MVVANAASSPSSAEQQKQEPPAMVVNQTLEQEARLVVDQETGGILSWFRWGQSSMIKLADSERRLLGRVRAHIVTKSIMVRLWNSSVHTLTIKPSSDHPSSPCPFVLMHGFAAGVGIWAASLDDLCLKRTVHAFDILGFGRSDRPQFSNDPTLAELEFVQSIEDWRRAMGIEQMVLVGHSFGGYLASSYTLEYPSRVRHLVLVDPWGFPERPQIEQLHIPVWMRAFGRVLSLFNPLATLRAAGPFGSRLVKKLRSDLGNRYAHQDPDAIYEYIYQCNALDPTGEIAFATMSKNFGWAKRPMINRFNGISPSVPVTFLWGGKSWMDPGPAYEIQARRQETSYVDVQIVTRAGHHVYADAPEDFCRLMGHVSDMVDADSDLAGAAEMDEWRDRLGDVLPPTPMATTMAQLPQTAEILWHLDGSSKAECFYCMTSIIPEQQSSTSADCSSTVHSLKCLQQLNTAVQNVLNSTDKTQPELFGLINQVTGALRRLHESLGQIEDVDRSEVEQRELIQDLQRLKALEEGSSKTEAAKGEKEGEERAEFRRDEQVSADGRNVCSVLCAECPSVILRPLAAHFLSSDDGGGQQISLPLPRQKKQSAAVEAEGEVQSTEHSLWWTVTDMMQFENVGFTNAFRGQRFLACADCEIGPIGAVCDRTGKFLV